MLTLKPMAVLTAMKADELDAEAREAAKVKSGLKQAQTVHKATSAAVGKIYYAVGVRTDAAKAANHLSQTTTFADIWKSITGEKPDGKGQQTAWAYSTFVKLGLIEEEVYDLCPGQMLEIAGSIAKSTGGVPTHESVVAAAVELKKHGKDSTKALQAILNGIKGEKEVSSEKAAEWMAKLLKDGHIEIAIAALGAAMPTVPAEKVKYVFLAMDLAAQLLSQNPAVTDSNMNEWLTEREKATKAPVLITA